MRKYDFISALARETAKEVVRNRDEWMKYLTTAARLYKYPFREQLLIYAQRPDATACASIELWNERMHCWVNKGAKEIKKPFAFEDELKEKTERLNALNIELNLNEKDTSVMDTEPEQTEEQPERKCASRER